MLRRVDLAGTELGKPSRVGIYFRLRKAFAECEVNGNSFSPKFWPQVIGITPCEVAPSTP
jgi:hypothetical protein